MSHDSEVPKLNLDNILNIIVDHGMHLPKYQVERMISPFLEIALPYALTSYYKTNGKELQGGMFEMICPEFPLKKEKNNQSTNIDYLMMHTKDNKKTLILIELKTDISSIRDNQKDFYQEIEDKNSGQIMHELINDIIKATKKKTKYQYILDRVSPYISEKSKYTLKTVYVLPTQSKEKSPKEWGSVEMVTLLDIANHLHADHEKLKSKLELIDNQAPYIS